MKTEPKWTPGAWVPDIVHPEVAAESTVACVYQAGATPLVDQPIAVVRSRGYTNETIAANAHLIAAAPRLYAALEALVGDQSVRNAATGAAIIEAEAALAAARGETLQPQPPTTP